MASTRIEVIVTMKSVYRYEAPAFAYGYETRYIYNMVGEDGTVYVWKTTAYMGKEVPDPDGYIIYEGKGTYRFDAVRRGDVLKIKATVKGQSEYKGEPQTEINRVKVLDFISRGEDPEEIKARKAAEKAARIQAQIDSIQGGDFVWKMPYKQYKEHYSDCETMIDSYETHRGRPATIKVIIREGRLKASGVRGQHFCWYVFEITEGDEKFESSYYAVSEKNAEKRCIKEFPDATARECVKVLRFGMC